MTLFVKHFTLNLVGFFFRKKDSAIFRHEYTYSYVFIKVFLYVYRRAWIFPTDFRKYLEYKIFWKSSFPETICSMWVGGRTDGWI